MKITIHQKNPGDAFLLITGEVESIKLLTDKQLLRETLQSLPNIIHMNTITEPIISEAANNPGLEGYIAIDESNITISTYTDTPRFVACIHSCNDFNYTKVTTFLKKQFQCKKINLLYVHESDFKNENDNEIQ